MRLSCFLLGKKEAEVLVGRARLNFYTMAKLFKRMIFTIC